MTGYLEDIRKMMYVCGDCGQPSVDSASLVETITHQQLVQLAEKAMDGARQRSVLGSEVTLSVEDIFFLMRRNKEKVKKVLYQIEFKAQARRASDNRQEGGPLEGGRSEGVGGTRLVVDSDFLTDMFGGDFYTADEAVQLQQDRMERHDSRTRGMEPDEYLNYVQCRQVSFVKNLGRFRKWLDLETVFDGQGPAHDVVEVLAYLAYDTIRELVELSLLVKQDMKRSRHKIISSLPPSLLPPSLISQAHSSHKSPQQPSQETDGGPATTTRASRNRKRKKSVSVDGTSDPIPDDSRQSLTQSGVGTEDGGRGIQPSHIREALRRLSVPSGPLLPLATSHQSPSYTQRTLCL